MTEVLKMIRKSNPNKLELGGEEQGEEQTAVRR